MCWGLASKLNTMVQYIAPYSLCSRFGSSDSMFVFSSIARVWQWSQDELNRIQSLACSQGRWWWAIPDLPWGGKLFSEVTLMNTYKRRIQAAKQISAIMSWYWLDRLWTSPRHTHWRWRFFANDCNWRCNYYDELRRPRKITTTNYALRRPRTTIATKYDYSSIGGSPPSELLLKLW